MQLQLTKYFAPLDELQQKFGDQNFSAIYGAGCINNPKILLLFMNPTGKNITAAKDWTGLRVPWISSKNIWQLIHEIGGISEQTLNKIKALSINSWTTDFVEKLYQEISANSFYITNLAKCTQTDARALPNSFFMQYLDLTKSEIFEVNPEKIVTFGNQVSSLILNKSIKVSEFHTNEYELLRIENKTYQVYPTFYPVGHGMRNISKTIERINLIQK